MRFLNRSEVRPWFEGRRVAIVGSGPGCDENSEGWVDSHEVVVRVNNFKTTARTGKRTDVFYSFFGTSIRKTSEELIRGGVKLCMSKVPNAHAIESEWHRRHGKMIGVDYRPHYERRKDWWFCDTYVPTVEEFLQPFNALERHQPTSGFAAIWDVLSFDPASVFLTGFDFFRSGIHNVNEPWMVKNTDDPIRHEPELERRWVAAAVNRYSIRCDKRLADAIA
jgi:hypothetical protein